MFLHGWLVFFVVFGVWGMNLEKCFEMEKGSLFEREPCVAVAKCLLLRFVRENEESNVVACTAVCFDWDAKFFEGFADFFGFFDGW